MKMVEQGSVEVSLSRGDLQLIESGLAKTLALDPSHGEAKKWFDSLRAACR